MENNIYNWLMAYKYGGSVVSTFMKMNIQGDKIKFLSSTVFVHKKWFKNFDNVKFNDVKYVFFIVNYLEEDWKILNREDQHGNKYYEIIIGLQKVINFIHEGFVNPNSYGSEAMTFWRTLEYGLSTKNSVDKIISNGVFIFLSDAWYNIVLAFKLSNIELNGGKISNRHIMKPSDFILGNFVKNLMISCDTELNLDSINKFYSNSYKNKLLSNKIDLNLYIYYKNNEYAIKHQLYEHEYFVNDEKGKELNQSHSIIKGYLFYNYNLHCKLLRKEINKKIYRVLNEELLGKERMENQSDEIRRDIKRLKKNLPLQDISKKKKKGIFDGITAELIEKKTVEGIEIKKNIFSTEKLINYLKKKIDIEYENNDFNKYNLIELEKYSNNLTELMEE